MFDLAKVKSRPDWRTLRTQIDTTVRDVFGELPKEHVDLQAKTLDETSFAGYTRRRINYFVDEWERISAWVFIPEGRDEVPAILCCHQAVPQGKDETAGIEGNPRLAFAHRFAEQGYVTIAPDSVAAGERRPIGLPPFDTKSFYKDNPKMSAFGKMLSDHSQAIDALCEIKRVDPARIGVVGHGLGGTNALLLAAFDERIQCAVASCAFTRFADDKHPERWASDDGFIGIPKLRDAIKQRKYPFDWEHVLALAAPTPLLVYTALNDEELNGTKSCDKAAKLARSVYKLLGAPKAFDHIAHNDGRAMSELALEQMDEWFERWL